ncbi:MAG TPA: extracellular solute-binding protein [Pseudonocardiaceae bacterium]
MRTRRHALLAAIVLPAVLAIGALAGCSSGTSGGAGSTTSTTTSPGTAHVLYAASLTNLMEKDLGPAFEKSTGGTFNGKAAGSTALVNDIKAKTTVADVFISASTSANDGLMGASNGNYESWYASFATSPLVLGYDPNSKFAADLKSKPWNEVVTEPGFRLGSTDPKLDPKGKLGAQAISEANLPANVATVFPEEQLVGRLQAGQLDAGFFYSSEAAEANIPTVTLGTIKLSATYTVTVLNNAQNKPAAIAFVQELLGPDGQALLKKHGYTLLPIKVTGDTSAVPTELHTVLGVK